MQLTGGRSVVAILAAGPCNMRVGTSPQCGAPCKEPDMTRVANAVSLTLGISSVLFHRTSFAQDAAATVSRWKEEIALPVRERIQEIAAAAPSFASEAEETLLAASPNGTLSWYFGVVLTIFGCAVVGWAAAIGVQRWGRGHFVYLFNPEPEDRAERIGYLLVRCLLQLVAVGVFYGVASVVWLAIGSDTPTAQATQEPIYDVLAALWALRVVALNILAPDAPSHRVLRISDADAISLYRALTIQLTITGVIAGTCMWMGNLGLSPYPHVLLLIAGAAVAVVLLSWVAVAYREPIATMALGPREERRLGIIRLSASVWHIFAVIYLLAAWATSAVRLMIGLPAAAGLIVGPIGVLLLAVAAYGAMLYFIDRIAGRPDTSRSSHLLDAVDAAPPADVIDVSQPVAPTRTFKELAEHAAALLVWFGAMWLVLSLWGVDVQSDDSWLVRLGDVIFITFLSYLGYEATRVAIDRKIVEEGGYELGEPGDEGGGASASRLATLLPLFRNFVLVTLAVLAGMIVLSQMGVDIAPLFAGAGVVGLAIGFGAQTLVRDIFSGAFFLMDDAFRLGEYINVEGTRGTVEKISIRSMQLRHHLGALHTIPFGEIKQLTNHSRDWAMMKLQLRVTYDTDVEKVRKLVKQLGAELLEHPEFGDKFLQPLKSQGVLRMEDSAMILRVKYMTRPGDQFVVRKQVYARLQELFAEQGIRFAHREVTVRVASGEHEGAPALTPAMAGATLPAIEHDGAEPGLPSGAAGRG